MCRRNYWLGVTFSYNCLFNFIPSLWSAGLIELPSRNPIESTIWIITVRSNAIFNVFGVFTRPKVHVIRVFKLFPHVTYNVERNTASCKRICATCACHHLPHLLRCAKLLFVYWSQLDSNERTSKHIKSSLRLVGHRFYHFVCRRRGCLALCGIRLWSWSRRFSKQRFPSLYRRVPHAAAAHRNGDHT